MIEFSMFTLVKIRSRGVRGIYPDDLKQEGIFPILTMSLMKF